MKTAEDYFSSWEGWYCEVENEEGSSSCGEVIESSTRALKRHLKEKHNIEVQ